jgi:hypothetical protein
MTQLFEVGTTCRSQHTGVIYTKYAPDSWRSSPHHEGLNDEYAAKFRFHTPPSPPLPLDYALDHSKRYVLLSDGDHSADILVWDEYAQLWRASPCGRSCEDFTVDTEIEEVREVREPPRVATGDSAPTSRHTLKEANAALADAAAEIARLKADREAFRKELNEIHIITKEAGDLGVGNHVNAVRSIIHRLKVSNDALAGARLALDEATNSNRKLRIQRDDYRLDRQAADASYTRLKNRLDHLINALIEARAQAADTNPSR